MRTHRVNKILTSKRTPCAGTTVPVRTLVEIQVLGNPEKTLQNTTGDNNQYLVWNWTGSSANGVVIVSKIVRNWPSVHAVEQTGGQQIRHFREDSEVPGTECGVRKLSPDRSYGFNINHFHCGLHNL